MDSKYGIKAGFFAMTMLISAQYAQAVDAGSTPVKTSPGQNVALYGQLDELRSQNAVLTETLKNAELKSKLNSGAGINGSGQTSQNPGSNMAYTGSAIPTSVAPISAQVQMVSGTGNNLLALISLSNGGRINAQIGSNISGIGVVKSISINEVVVVSKTQTISLPFASETSSAPAGFSLPPMPQGMMPNGPR